jgi:DNA-binding MarR family transcriptional regulator
MEKSVQYLLNMMLNKSEQLEEKVKQHSILHNLTTRQLQCIELVYELKNPTLSEIASQFDIKRPSATVLIDRLARDGYLLKVKSDSDRRSAHVHLTEKGEMAAEMHTEVHSLFAKKLTSGLTDSEIYILSVLLDKALRGYEKSD